MSCCQFLSNINSINTHLSAQHRWKSRIVCLNVLPGFAQSSLNLVVVWKKTPVLWFRLNVFVQLAATGQRLIRVCEVSQKVSKMLRLLSDLVSLGNITYAQCRKPHEFFFQNNSLLIEDA